MKQEEKDLLLKDLCGRLPYGVIVAEFDEDCRRTSIALPLVSLENDFSFYGNLKPYLFPLSSMTEEQEKKYGECFDVDLANSAKNLNDRIDGKDVINGFPMHNHIDWLNKNHFDYRGLINKGLAIDATGLNIY